MPGASGGSEVLCLNNARPCFETRDAAQLADESQRTQVKLMSSYSLRLFPPPTVELFSKGERRGEEKGGEKGKREVLREES